VKISQKVPLVTSIIVIASFAIFSKVQYNIVQSAMLDKLESNITETSVVLSQQITNWLNGKLALIDMMTGTIDADFDMQTIQTTMDNPLLKEAFILIYGVLDTDGKMISNTPSWSPPAGWDGRKRPWYPLARSRTGAVLTEPYADTKTQEVLISVVSCLKDNGEFQGAFGGDLSMKAVSDAINTLNFNNTGYAFLINSQEKIISHPDSSLNGKQLSALFTDASPMLNNSLQEVKLGDKVVLTKFSSMKGLANTEWLIGVVLDKKKAMAEVNALKVSAIIGMLISGLISSFVLYITMARLLLNPIHKLIATADEISLGKLDFEIMETERNDEIGSLAKAIERLGVSVQLAIKRLQEK